MKNQKQMMYGGGGLLIGFIIGILLAGSAGIDLAGTAVSDTDGGDSIAIEFVPSKYFLIPIEDAEAWLQANNPDVYQEISSDITVVGGMYDANDISTYYAENGGSVDTVLISLQNTLFADRESEDDTNTCIGINQDVYTGPGVYVYVEVSPDLADNVPDSWEELDGPKENDILWSTECLESDAE